MVLFKKEKEVIKLINTFLDEVENCLIISEKTIQTYLESDVKKAKRLARKVRELETQADVCRYDIRNMLYTGAYLPGMREDIYNIVESIDKVANAAEACCGFFLNQRPAIRDDMVIHFVNVTKEALGCREPLKEAALFFFNSESSMDEIHRFTQRVSFIESDVDKSEWDLTKLIFTSSIDYCRKIHLKLSLDSITEISDRAEDAADQLELAALKSAV
jgi:predicted phosphate transport protein (TIGR00153 family)